jgi:hypothetical protein
MITIKLAELYPKTFAVSVRNAEEEKVFERYFAEMKKRIRGLRKRQVLL